jgi:DNA-binding transcriptional regulator YiaG
MKNMTPEEIREIRKNLGITQEKFAHLLGTTVASVNKWEAGRVKPSRLSLKELKEIKNNYGSYVCRREEHKNS